MANQSIKIPIELELNQLQSQVSTLKNALKGVKPETDSWNKLNGMIGKLESQMDALRRHSSKTFSSTSEIKAFEKEFNKVIEGVETAADAFKRVKFSELIVDPKSLTSINELKIKIEEVKKTISNAEKTSISEIFSPNDLDLQGFLRKSGIATLPSTFKEIISLFGKQSNTLQKQVNDIIKKEEELVTKTKKYKEALQGMLNLDEGTTTESKLDQIFSKYFNSENFDKGKIKKDIGLSLKNDLMALDIGITQDDIRKLLSTDSVDFEKAFSAIKEGIFLQLEKLKKELDDWTEKRRDKELDASFIEVLKEDAERGQENFKNVISKDLQSQLNNLIAELKKAKQEQINLSSVMSQTKGVLSSTSQIYSNLTQQIAKSETQLNSMIKVQEQLNSIRNAAVRFLGFNEIINTTKRVVKDAATEIKELDSVMTEIAVVTDMTQEDLWAQMGTYEEIANQYGVSIRGTYEVSQLFYQQGKWLNI